ncbi:MAG: hypothetical protein P1P80_00980 [ANME-2 cluster archaeon]|nr:hypothetical protein [ANME-2 cluster archaeon]
MVLLSGLFGKVAAETYNVEASVEQTGPDTISVTYNGGEDEWKVNHITVNIDGSYFSEGVSEGSLSYLHAFGSDGNHIPAGKTIYITDTTGTHITQRKDRVKVFAEFLDGTIMCLVDEQL